MTADQILTFIGSGFLAAVVPAIIGALQRRSARKAAEPLQNARAQTETEARLGAENKRLDDRNMSLEARLDAMQRRIDALTTKLTVAESKIDELEAREEARDDLLRKHEAWDDVAEHLVRSVVPAVHLPPRPPLTLPSEEKS